MISCGLLFTCKNNKLIPQITTRDGESSQMSHHPAESPQVGAVAGVEEDSGEGEADREAQPYSVDAETGLEAEDVC